MMRYLMINGIVLLITFLVAVYFTRQDHIARRTITQTSLVLTALTAVFDPLIIYAGIVGYNRDLTLGLNLFGAPIEDLAYALVAAILVPLLWRYYEKH